jgi:hypothetical protein
LIKKLSECSAAPPHHLPLWTQQALKKLLERVGFHVFSVKSKPLGWMILTCT